MTRNLIPNLGLILLYASLTISSALYLINANRYREVASWPSVDAVITSHSAQAHTLPHYGMTGCGPVRIETRSVGYEYSVDGLTYAGRRLTPNGGSQAPIYPEKPLRAYYKQQYPSIAVLSPIPFQRTELVVMTGFSSIFVATHLGLLVWQARRSTEERTTKGVA